MRKKKKQQQLNLGTIAHFFFTGNHFVHSPYFVASKWNILCYQQTYFAFVSAIRRDTNNRPTIVRKFGQLIRTNYEIQLSMKDCA